MGPIDSFEVADNIPLNVDAKRIRGLDLVIGGRVEVEDRRTCGYNLIIEEVNGCKRTASTSGF